MLSVHKVVTVVSILFGASFNSLHATGLYIDYMNNSIAKKEKEKKARKKVTEPG